jgi:hypothetical protein
MVTRLQVVVIIVGLVVVLGLFAGIESYRIHYSNGNIFNQRVTTNQPNGPLYFPGTKLYDVSFQQRGACAQVMWQLPWAVTFNGQTQVRPSNATIPPPYFYGTFNASLAVIVFHAPNGSYRWKSYPTTVYDDDPISGVVNVNSSNVTVQVDGEPTGCTETASSSSAQG